MTDKPGVAALPQIISILPVDANGKISIKKEVKKYLGTDQGIRLVLNGEVMLTAGSSGDGIAVQGRRLELPPSVLESLDVSDGSLIALVERKGALALKKIEIEEQEAEQARAIDNETQYRIARTVGTNAMPDELLPVLADRYREHELQYDIMTFLSGRRSLEAWTARGLLHKREANDEKLGETLIGDRLREQQEDGSWQGEAMVTARMLRELTTLGLTRRSKAVREGAEWLLSRAESEANPGMFFLSDRLVAKQADILMKRKAVREGRAKGTLGKLRFAARTPPESKRVSAADDILPKPCGTRVMWPNALVLEALLGLNYEDHPRVQRALASLLMGYTYWCECNYQLKAGNHVRHGIPGDRELAEREQDCINQYRYGGASRPEEYLEVPRASRLAEGNREGFLLSMSRGIQTCEVMTTRALQDVRSSRVHRAAAAHLWRFAGTQQQDGRFTEGTEGVGYCPSHAHMLQVFSGYDHPASSVAIMRSVPWIIDNQQPDGSWGEDTNKDPSTLAVIQALLRVHDLLPAIINA